MSPWTLGLTTAVKKAIHVNNKSTFLFDSLLFDVF